MKNQAFPLIILMSALPNFLQAAASSSTEPGSQEEQEHRAQTPNVQTITTEKLVKTLLENGFEHVFKSRETLRAAALNPYIAGSKAAEDLLLISYHLDLPTGFQSAIDGISRAYLFYFKGDKGGHPLPKWLAQHFTGLSIQDLINHDMMLASINKYWHINLSNKYISDLTGINNIPEIENIQRINLSDNLFRGELNTRTFAGLARLCPHLYVLNLNNNQITSIHPGSFEGFTLLQELDLSVNQIADINPGTFEGLVRLEKLALTYNRITALNPGAFAGLADLWWLFLNNNRIANINQGAFKGLSKLGSLTLDGNQLKNINQGAFKGLSRLQTLSLNNNNIVSIAFNGLTNLSDIYLKNNKPFIWPDLENRIREEARAISHSRYVTVHTY